MSVTGIGPIISSAMVAAIGAGDAFTKGRDFAAWLGLVPRQMSTGDRTILGKISKRGNRYLRVLFVQAAWVVLIKPKSRERTGSSPGSRRPRNGCITTCWRLHWPTNLLASPGVYWLAVEASRRASWIRQLRDCVIVNLGEKRAYKVERCDGVATSTRCCPPRSARGRDEMEVRSSRRLRTLVTQMAQLRPFR